jgi:hypothetical protein
MAKPNWLNENVNRAYPFVRGTVDDGSSALRGLPDAAVADAGFVMGVDSGYAPADTVYLYKLVRQGPAFQFYFATTAPTLDGSYLVFTRQLTDPDYLSEQVDSSERHAGSWSAEPCDEPLWSGFLVSGRMSEVAAFLPGDGELVRVADDDCTLEPALVHNLAGCYVKMIALANADRTRVDAPPGCDEVTWPFDVGAMYVNARCLQGDVLFMPGYNSTVRQDAQANAITFGASVGAGQGEPCAEVSLFGGESLSGDGPLDGSPTCAEVLRSFNGVGGPLFNFAAGQGVDVTAVPGESKIIIDVNLAGLAGCAADSVSVVSLSDSV